MDSETVFQPGQYPLPTGNSNELSSDLYVGRIIQAYGSIQINGKNQPALVWGEVVFRGRLVGPTFVLEDLRRVALYGTLADLKEDQRIGTFSLAGPLDKPIPSPEGLLFFRQQLHYAALSTQLEPLIQSDDAIFPQMEQIAATLLWATEGQSGGNNIRLIMSIMANDVVEKKLGIVQAIMLDRVPLEFRPIKNEAQRGLTVHHSLTANCPPPQPCASANQPLMCLPLKFVNFSTKSGTGPYDWNKSDTYEPPSNIEGICNTQIDKVCEVWRSKAALQLDVQTQVSTISNGLVSQQQIRDFTDFNTADSYMLQSPTFSHNIDPATNNMNNCVEVYLVNSITTSSGGGITFSYNNNTASIVCILSVAEAQANPYLLAHELGHILGLAHPDGTHGILVSSPGTIMEPAPNPPYNPPNHTLYNCRIFDSNLGSLNPIVQTIGPMDCFRPDPVRHLIRDFPGDIGNQPSVPPAGQNGWSNSNVWNRHKDRPGSVAASGGPKHEQPITSDRNFMHVRLEHITTCADPVTVELYLSDPGVATNILRPIEGNYRLEFPSRPRSRVRSLRWTVPVGYSNTSCIVAVSYSVDVPSPLLHLTPGIPINITQLAQDYSSVTQRGVNMQNVALLNPRSVTTTLAWVQLNNPSEKEASAKIEIDTTQAVALEKLVLELNDEVEEVITIGEIVTVHIANPLQPGERKILRFRATIPSGLAKGTELPIHLHFYLGDKFINGYSHILSVTSITAAASQTLDKLFSAMRDTGVAFNPELGRIIAGKTQKMATREIQLMESSGYFGVFLWGLLRPKSLWRSEIIDLAADISSMAANLERKSDPDCQAMAKKLLELSALVSTSQDMEDVLLIEGIRDQADRIQEQAGWLARLKMQDIGSESSLI